MYSVICREYGSLPDPQSLEWHEIRFFYEAMRRELLEMGKRVAAARKRKG